MIHGCQKIQISLYISPSSGLFFISPDEDLLFEVETSRVNFLVSFNSDDQRNTDVRQPQQTLQHINPSHQDEPFQGTNYGAKRRYSIFLPSLATPISKFKVVNPLSFLSYKLTSGRLSLKRVDLKIKLQLPKKLNFYRYLHRSLNELIPDYMSALGTWHWFVLEKRQMKNNFYVNDKFIEIYLD